MVRASRRKQIGEKVKEYETVCVKAHCDNSITLDDGQSSGM
jgi:hypothetical protein